MTSEALPTIRPTGKSVARLREQLNLSVAEFAAQLGVTVASVYRWEASEGRLNLRTKALHALALLTQEQKQAEAERTKRRSQKKKAKVAKTETLPKLRPTGRSVERLRHKLGLTVAEFAEEMGVTVASVYRWEASDGRLTLRTRAMEALTRLHVWANQP